MMLASKAPEPLSKKGENDQGERQPHILRKVQVESNRKQTGGIGTSVARDRVVSILNR
jgi:hypothetical protein